MKLCLFSWQLHWVFQKLLFQSNSFGSIWSLMVSQLLHSPSIHQILILWTRKVFYLPGTEQSVQCIYKTNKSHHDHHQTLLFLLGYWFVTPLLVSMLVGQLLLVPPGGLCSPKVVLKWPGGNWPIICNVRHSQKTLLEWIVEYSRMLIQWQWRYQSLLLSKCSMLWTQDRVPHENLILFRNIFIV